MTYSTGSLKIDKKKSIFEKSKGVKPKLYLLYLTVKFTKVTLINFFNWNLIETVRSIRIYWNNLPSTHIFWNIGVKSWHFIIKVNLTKLHLVQNSCYSKLLFAYVYNSNLNFY